MGLFLVVHRFAFRSQHSLAAPLCCFLLSLSLCLCSDLHHYIQWSFQSFLTDFKAFCLPPARLSLHSTITNNYIPPQKNFGQCTATSPTHVSDIGWTCDPAFFPTVNMTGPRIGRRAAQIEADRVSPQHCLRDPQRKGDSPLRLLS